MLEALLRRFLLCEGSTLPDGLKLNLLSSSDIAGGVTLPSFIAAAAAKSRGASSAAKRAWAAYLRSFLPLVGPRDQCVVSAIHARLILDVNIEVYVMYSCSTCFNMECHTLSIFCRWCVSTRTT